MKHGANKGARIMNNPEKIPPIIDPGKKVTKKNARARAGTSFGVPGGDTNHIDKNKLTEENQIIWLPAGGKRCGG